MIPIKLLIQGLYSYQDAQEIDFQPLTGTSVFGIFGKVGSGKTSLLEAISFALYGRTERLNEQDKRAYNMMNLKSKHLRIDFEFRAGPEQQLYKFIYEAKRHPKKHHEISPGERRMFVRQADDWHPIGNEKEDISALAKQILGLDYDNFKRTIIIPQNQFREFLELSPTERTGMMNQLFKLEQYDLAGRVKKLTSVNDNQLAELRGLLSPLEAITPEAIDQAELALTALQEAIQTKEAAIKQVEPTEQRLLHAQTQEQVLATLRRELAGLQTQANTYQQLRQTVALYQTCRLVFQADLINLRKQQDKQTGLLQERTKAAEKLTALTSQLAGLRSVYEAAKKAYDGRHRLQQQIEELYTVERLRLLQESIDSQTKTREQVNIRLHQHKTAVDQYKVERAKYQVTIDTLLGQESSLERLYQIENWFALHKPMKKQADDLQNQLVAYEAAVEQIKDRKDRALAGFPNEWAAFTLKTLPAQIDAVLHQLKMRRQHQEVTYRQAFVKQEFVQYADSLVDGSPCPLCGSAHHPSKHAVAKDTADADRIKQELVASEQALNTLMQRIDDTTALRLLIEGLTNELRGVLENGKRLIKERTEAVRQLTDHEDKFVWSDFTKEQEDEVTGAIRTASEEQKQVQESQRTVRELTRQIDEIDSIQRDETQTLSAIENVISGLQGALETEIESLEHYQLAEIAGWALVQITDLRDSIGRTYDQTKTNFEAADHEKTDAEKRQATFTEQFQQVSKQLTSLADDIQDMENTLNQNLTEQRLTRDVVEQVLQSQLDTDQEKQRIAEYDDKCTGLRKQINDLEDELQKHPFDAEALITVKKQLNELRDQKDGLNKESGRQTNVLTTLRRQWSEKQAHQQRHDELDLRRQDLKKMDDLFRAQGFVNYVSSVYLKNLCESANDRFFKLTNNQLKLELDEKNNFQVRDFLNGGEVRSVKTLSGGQTFQAALSLALALSDNIQHLTKAKQNLFFLDEGFGTLDKDSLQTVFKTLKALRSENRVVGIISHVEELQQEVDMYIRTEATENGSRIIRSWEE